MRFLKLRAQYGLAVLVASVWLTACSAMIGATPTPDFTQGDPERGKALFSATGCIQCHAVVPDVKIVGPSLFEVGARAATHQDGMTAEQYLYESITDPNAFIVEGFQPDLMPKTFKDILIPEDIADIIAYLETLH